MKDVLNKIYVKYMELIMDAQPSKAWKAARFVLHWLTLPIKLLAIAGLGGFQIIRQKFTIKNRPVPAMPTDEKRLSHLTKLMAALPVYRGADQELYVNRVNYMFKPDLKNHNYDHQSARHGTYAFLMGAIGKRTPEIDNAMAAHVYKGQLSRGYKKVNGVEPAENSTPEVPIFKITETTERNNGSVSGDMLIGYSLGMLNRREESSTIADINGSQLLVDGANGYMKERFDEMLHGLIENDYAILEGRRPEDGDINQAMWDRIEAYNEKAIDKKKMKSIRGMWQPGLETVGAQALTILCALRVGDKVLGAAYAKKEYRKLLYRYGYGLLSLFPTAFTKKSRGYFNDSNCMVALYILSTLADTKLGKLFWRIPMKYVFSLSKPWYNGYFAGLLNDAHPGSVSQKYLDACVAYLYEEELPVTISYEQSANLEPKECPIVLSNRNQDEFLPDQGQSMLLPEGLTPEEKGKALVRVTRYRSGLGILANAIMLEKTKVKELLSDSTK